MNKEVSKPKKAARSNSFVIPLATVSGLLILFLVYVFWYVSAQDKYYNDRAFRVLSVLSDSFAGKVRTIGSVLGASTALPNSALEQASGASQDRTRTYAPANDLNHARAYVPAKNLNQTVQPSGAAARDTDTAEQYVAKYLDEYGVMPQQVSANWKRPCSQASRDGKLSLRLEDSTDFSMQAVYTLPDTTVECQRAKTDKPFEISAIVHLRPSVRSLIEELNEGFYEDVLIADADGVVVYQQSNRGVQISDLNDLVRLRPDGSAVVAAPDKPEAASSAPEKPGRGSPQDHPTTSQDESKPAAAKSNGPFSTISGSGNIANVQLGDSSVRLYLQPTLLTIQKKSRVSRLVFCGLRSAKHVQADTLSIPNTLVIWGALVLPLAFALGWPLLKVFYVSPKERLQFGQILALLFTILVGTVLLTLTTLNWSYTSRENDDSEDRLPKVAARMKSQVQFEMQQALTELNRLSTQEDLLPNLMFGTKEATKSWQIAQYFQTHLSSYQKTDANPSPPYSYFRYAVLLDVDGWQRAKFTAEWPTPRVNAGKETYFQEVRLSNLDAFIPQGTISPSLANPTLFRLDVSTSPNTGEIVPILSAPYSAASSGQRLGLSLSASKANANRPIQEELLVMKFESLVDSILPPGYGFAVLNRAGKVQFHSVSRRILLEDFLEESQFNPELVSLLQQGGTDFFHARYLGRAQVLYITPLDIFQHPPLSLVVFRDDDRATAGNKAVVAVYGFLAIAYILALWILIIIYFCAIGLNYPLHGIWPALRRQESYIRVGVTSLILLGALLFGYRSLQPTDTVYFALALGFVSFLAPLTELEGHPFWAYFIRILVVGYLATLLYYSSGIVSWTFYLSLIALLRFAWSSKFSNLLYRLRRFSFPWKAFVLNCTYTFVAISLLLSIVVVPCIGFFRFGYETVERRAVQLDQIELAGQLAQRHDRIHRYYDRIHARDLEKQRQDDLIDRHDLAFFNCMASPTDVPAGEDELKDSTLEDFLGNIAEVFQSDTYSGLLELERTREPRQFEWHIAKDSASAACASFSSPLIVLKAKSSKPNSSQPKYLIASEVPHWQGYTAGGRTLLVLAILFLSLWIYFVTVRIFLIDWEDAPKLEFIDSLKELRGSTIIIGHPKSGKSTSAGEIIKGVPIDFAELAATGKWDVILPADPRLILDHFECGIDDPAINLKKLEFLERLVHVEHRKIILLSTVDPMFYLVSGFPEVVSSNPDDLSSSVQILDRWAAIFSDFHKATFEDRSIRKFSKRLGIQQDKLLLPGADKKQSALHLILMDVVRQECDHTATLRKIGFRLLMTRLQNPDNPGVSTLRKEIVEDVLDHADAYYRSLWSTCTKNERLVLYQLSKDGWANPRNRKELQDLKRRGLIVKNSGFHVMNLSFRQFVLNYQYPEEVAAWDQEVNRSTGKAVRNSLLVAAAVLGVWLIYSQQQVFHLAIGYVGAIGGAAATVSGLVAALRIRGTRAAPDAAKSA